MFFFPYSYRSNPPLNRLMFRFISLHRRFFVLFQQFHSPIFFLAHYQSRSFSSQFLFVCLFLCVVTWNMSIHTSQCTQTHTISTVQWNCITKWIVGKMRNGTAHTKSMYGIVKDRIQLLRHVFAIDTVKQFIKPKNVCMSSGWQTSCTLKHTHKGSTTVWTRAWKNRATQPKIN